MQDSKKSSYLSLSSSKKWKFQGKTLSQNICSTKFDTIKFQFVTIKVGVEMGIYLSFHFLPFQGNVFLTTTYANISQ